MIRAYRYKLRPTPEQEVKLTQALETMRRLYNDGLRERRDLLESEGKHLTFYGQKPRLVSLRKESEYLKALPYCMASGCWARLDEAWKAFRKRWSARSKAGESCPPQDAGLPRFSRFGEFSTLTYDSKMGNGWAYLAPNPNAGPNERKNAAVRATPFGTLRCIKDRVVPDGAKILTRFEITRTPSGWFASILADDGVEAPTATEGDVPVVTLTLAIEPFVTLSDGRTFSLPDVNKDAPVRVPRLQRAMDRRKAAGAGRSREIVAALEKDETLTEEERDRRIRIAKTRRSVGYQIARHRKQKEEAAVHNRRKLAHYRIARAILAGMPPGAVLLCDKPQTLRKVKHPAARPDAEGGKGSFLPNGATRKAERSRALLGTGPSAFLTILEQQAARSGILIQIVTPPKPEKPDKPEKPVRKPRALRKTKEKSAEAQTATVG